MSITLLILMFLQGCTWLLTPNVKTALLQLEQGAYKLDPSHTSVIFKVSHLNLSTYVGRFNEMDASLEFDPKNIEKTRLTALVKTASIDVNNQSLEESLTGSSWFDAEKFPEATLRTISVEETETANQFIFNAELTLLGVSKTVALTSTFNGGAYNLLTGYYTLGFTAVGEISRSDFGMDQYIPMVGDTVAIEVYAEFLKQ
ncbi:YceI family protein [Aliikangiella marina]|nr:YceI family protein [Aliikangiella marina]